MTYNNMIEWLEMNEDIVDEDDLQKVKNKIKGFSKMNSQKQQSILDAIRETFIEISDIAQETYKRELDQRMLDYAIHKRSHSGIEGFIKRRFKVTERTAKRIVKKSRSLL